MSTVTQQPVYICRHVRTNGLRCGSPALRNKPWCFHHERFHYTPPTPPAPDEKMQEQMQRNPLVAEYFKPVPAPLNFPPLEDRESIQVALSMLITAMAHDRIEPKSAGNLLYALQIASHNARGLRNFGEFNSVRDITLDEQGTPLASKMYRMEPNIKNYGEEDDDDQNIFPARNT